MTLRTIDDVLTDLDRIVVGARDAGNPAGYFPALYRRVTREVKRWIDAGRFDDGPRMERLDVVFADRYLDAWRCWEAGTPLTRSWTVAFEAAEDWSPIVLQHLLLGMNAHINLDLGVAAATVARGADIQALEGDFHRINEVLASLVDEVEDRLAGVWPLLHLLDWVGGRSDEATVNFSMERARDASWRFAARLAETPPGEWNAAIAEVDAVVAAIGEAIRHPGLLLGAVTRVVRLGELRSRAGVIDLLSRPRNNKP